MKNEIDPRPEQSATPKNEQTEVASPDNQRHLRLRSGIRAGAGMVCPTDEC